MNEMRSILTYQSIATAELISKRACSGLIMPGILATVLVSNTYQELTPEKKNPPVKRADSAQGDGGVDVTGAPKSGSVEGADFGQLFCLSDWKRSFVDRIPSEIRVDNCFLGGSNF